jgi:hypothetical protein
MTTRTTTTKDAPVEPRARRPEYAHLEHVLGGAHMPPLPLELAAPRAADRAAAIEKRRTEIDALHAAREAAVRNAMTAARLERDEAIAETDAAAARGRAHVASAIVRTWHAEAGPLARAWVQGETTRARSTAIATLFSMLDVRAREELGDELAPELLACALVDALVDGDRDRASVFGLAEVWHASGLLGLVAGCRLVLDDARAFHERMISLEAAIAAIARSRPCVEPVARWAARYDLVRTSATRADRFAALEAFDTRPTSALPSSPGEPPRTVERVR